MRVRPAVRGLRHSDVLPSPAQPGVYGNLIIPSLTAYSPHSGLFWASHIIKAADKQHSSGKIYMNILDYIEQACCAGCRRRSFTAEALLIGKMHPFSKIAVTFEPVQQFRCPAGF